MPDVPGPMLTAGGEGPLQRLVGHLNSRTREDADPAYLDGVRDMIAAAIELLVDFQERVRPSRYKVGSTEPDQEPIPLDRAAQRIATELRLTGATLSRLARREELNATGQIDPDQLPIIADVVRLVLVAAHALERVQPAEDTHGAAGWATNGLDDLGGGDNAANWLAAFVVSVAANREPTEEDADELRRLCQGDTGALDAARTKMTEADDLPESVRGRALSLLEAAGHDGRARGDGT